MKRLILGALLFLGVVVLAACSDSDEELTPVTVMLDWTPNTNHMGISSPMSRAGTRTPASM